MGNFTPIAGITETAFRNQTMNVRIPFEISAEGMKNTNEAGSKRLRFIHIMKQTKKSSSDRRKKETQKITIMQKERTKLRINGKNTMAMLNFDEFKRHSVCTVDGIFCAARRTQSAFATKRDKFKFTAFFACVQSTAKGSIPAVNHFVNIFHYDRPRLDNILYVFVMVCEDLLKNVHTPIISYFLHMQNTPS